MGAILTYIRSTVLANGDVEEIRTNPGAAPARYINGVRQPFRDSKIELKWVRYFAIRPRRINGHFIWLKWAYRAWDCRAIHNGFGGRDGSYCYGDLFDVLASNRE